jgi:hypothetical protein
MKPLCHPGKREKMIPVIHIKPGPRQIPCRPILLLAFMLAALFLSACASTTPKPDNTIVKRAQDRWAALLADDFETAYSYYSPGYRSTTSVIDFAFKIRARRVRWTSAEYKEHSCAENSCTLVFKVGFTVNKPVPGLDKYDGSDTTEEKWVKTDGQWWYLPKN